MLFEKIKSDLTEALKAHDSNKVSILRLVVSEIKNFEIANYPPSSSSKMTDEEELSVVKKMVKTHRESIEMFEKGDRKDLVDKERLELDILQSYLPEQMGEDEVLVIVKEVVSLGEKDFGKVMKLVMAKLKGKADGKMVSEMVKKELNK